MLERCCLMVCAFTVLWGLAAVAAVGAEVPRPLPDHPGNVFLTDEQVSVELPSGEADLWQITDYDGRVVAEGEAEEDRANAGRLPVGHFELRRANQGGPLGGSVRLAVLAPLKVPTPADSPIAVDTGISWYWEQWKDAQRAGAVNLCALAGVNWVRERLRWSEVEPEKGRIVEPNKYDETARLWSNAGLRVLQVHHSSARWANRRYLRFPRDLRDAHGFHRRMAERWKGQVLAFEAWNEADLERFGGHIGSEIAALQKASYLGLKAGNRDVISCTNGFAHARPTILANFHENEAWPYFDTFNLHHYVGVDEYPGFYPRFSAASGGRPLWVTECNVWDTRRDRRLQAERVAKIYAGALHQGAKVVYYFLFRPWTDGRTSYGVIRKDLAPQPAYLAMAAAGRLLAGARAVGCWQTDSDAVRAFVFHAEPDGKARQVLVAWSTGDEVHIQAPVAPKAVFDHLGRPRDAEAALRPTREPLYAVFPEGTFGPAHLEAPPEPAEYLPGEPSSIVLQSWQRPQDMSLQQSAYRVSRERVTSLPVYAYNFGQAEARGTLSVSAPDDWKVTLPEQVNLQPDERKELTLDVQGGPGPAPLTELLRIEGDFGTAGRTVLALRLMALPLRPGSGMPIEGADDPSRWEPQISGDGRMEITRAEGGGILVDAEPRGGDRWGYPALKLRPGERPDATHDALGYTITVLEDEWGTQYRATFDEKGGSSYASDVAAPPKQGDPVRTLAPMIGPTRGVSWSEPDPNGKLDAEEIVGIRVGFNTGRKTDRVRYIIKDLAWHRTNTR
jgi:hypothetical protein